MDWFAERITGGYVIRLGASRRPQKYTHAFTILDDGEFVGVSTKPLNITVVRTALEAGRQLLEGKEPFWRHKDYRRKSMAMIAYTPPRMMYNQVRNELLALEYPVNHGLFRVTITPSAPTGVNDIAYFDDILGKVVGKVWTITKMDLDIPPTGWNGLGFTYVNENDETKTLDIRVA